MVMEAAVLQDAAVVEPRLEPLVEDQGEPMLDLSFREPIRAIEPEGSLDTLQVERVGAVSMIGHRAAWADLARRALEPNLFYEPGFAIPLLQHVFRKADPEFVLVWEEGGLSGFSRLLGLLPLAPPDRLSGLAGITRGLTYNQIVSGVPLVDRDHPGSVLDAAFAWLAEDGGGRALALKDIPEDGPFRSALAQVCTDTSRELATVDTYRRAVLARAAGGEDRLASFVSAKRRKEQARLSRRLSALGTRTYASARTPADIAAATERYLALEQAGWKGARGTALLSDPALAAFVRSMTRTMAETGACRVDAIEIDGRPVAMGMVLTTRDRAYFWKTAFDESHASLSPGVQFTLELTQRLMADTGVASTDSCAVADHPMIDRIWPDRLAMADVMVALRPGDNRRFRRLLRLERLRHALRDRAKTALHRLRRLRRG